MAVISIDFQNMTRNFVLVLLGLLMVPSAISFGAEDLVRGKAIFDQMCSGCHGTYGDGGAGHRGGFSPHPSSLANKPYMDGLTDKYLMLVIKKGGAFVGKIAAMPAWELRLSDGKIRDVIAHIRTLVATE